MRKFGLLLISILLLFISYISFRLSIPYFEINQVLNTKDNLLNHGANFNLGGVFVTSVTPESPASKSGIEVYSQITQINNNTIRGSIDFLSAIRANLKKPVTLTVCKLSCNEIIIIPREQSPSGQGPLGIQIQDVSFYNKSTIQIIAEQFYSRFIGGDFFSLMFGSQTLIYSWLALIIGAVSLIFSIKFVIKVLHK